jgi:tripartite-type tricarboxylate transporter receptor subunit TctC
MRTFSSIAAVLCLAVSAVAGAAQTTYPNRPIQLIVAAAPGGSIDILARLVAPKLTSLLGQPVVSVNRGGAGGIVGGTAAAQSAPDGYTFLITTSGLLVFDQSTTGGQRFDGMAGLAPIGIVASFPNVLIVSPKKNFNSVRDIVARAKANPGKVSFSSGGDGTSNHRAAELLQHKAGIEMLHVSYRGGGPALQAVLAGDVDMMFVAPSPALPHMQAGTLKALAVTSRQRSSLVPGVPTMIEAGVPDFELVNWIGVLAPKGISAEVGGKFSRAIAEAARSPDVAEAMTKSGYEAVGSSADQMLKAINGERAMWARFSSATASRVPQITRPTSARMLR